MMLVTQEDGYLEVEESFLIRPRFQWSVRLFGRLLCRSLSPQIWVLYDPLKAKTRLHVLVTLGSWYHSDLL
jgi:hypothetical protein